MYFWTTAWDRRLEKDTLFICRLWVSSSNGCQSFADNGFCFSARLSENWQLFFSQYDMTHILFGGCLYICSQKKKSHLSLRLPELAAGQRCQVVPLQLDGRGRGGPRHSSASTGEKCLVQQVCHTTLLWVTDSQQMNGIPEHSAWKWWLRSSTSPWCQCPPFHTVWMPRPVNITSPSICKYSLLDSLYCIICLKEPTEWFPVCGLSRTRDVGWPLISMASFLVPHGVSRLQCQAPSALVSMFSCIHHSWLHGVCLGKQHGGHK